MFGQSVNLMCDPKTLKMTSGCGGAMTILFAILMATFFGTEIQGMLDHSKKVYEQTLNQVEAADLPKVVGKEF